MFQHTAARRRLVVKTMSHKNTLMFQHTAARRRLDTQKNLFCFLCCFNTQPPEGGWGNAFTFAPAHDCFNTQPPEGGWANPLIGVLASAWFQHTAARRRLDSAARPCKWCYGFNTQPPEGGWPTCQKFQPPTSLFQHTAARRRLGHCLASASPNLGFQHTAARRRLVLNLLALVVAVPFQHTAARRRLDAQTAKPADNRGFNTQPPEGGWSPNLSHQVLI